ncbi:MAG: hypothetical protein B6D59_02265 [Campylobacteraceae bacterium 4484_4]|nr:MAG: hypothetical protein B6D59_02265 [Campylobacteraceae bacterium 4484_4]
MSEYTILIEDLRIETIIGMLESERVTKQPVVVSCAIVYEKERDLYLDYAKVAALIEEMLQRHRYLLLEEALAEIVAKISRDFQGIRSIWMRLSKPEILPNGRVGVECFRKF